jgi:ABC-2 type transport system ATP-binding protein
MLDIFRPDRGAVSVFGGPMCEEKKRRFGYMPEERGLYQSVSLERCLLYLATLKGMPTPEARRRLEIYLEHFDLVQYRQKKVKTLSKGMQQKAQIISTILHQPELLVIDEPFAALDPVNTELVKRLLRELRDRGTAILMSTHQMHHAEALCDRIVLIHRGRNVLYGSVDEIRRRFAGDTLLVRARGGLPPLTGVRRIASRDGTSELSLEPETRPPDVLRALVAHNVDVEQFEIAMPGLNEIFIRVVRDGGSDV